MVTNYIPSYGYREGVRPMMEVLILITTYTSGSQSADEPMLGTYYLQYWAHLVLDLNANISLYRRIAQPCTNM